MPRFFFAALFLAAPLALTACADSDDAPSMPMGADATHEMADGAMMDGAEHEHMASGATDGPTEPQLIDGVQVLDIEAGPMGFQPRKFTLQAGVPARLVITRTVEDDCSSQLTIPAYDIDTERLPLHEPVAIEFTPTDAGEVEWVCGMDMQRGTVAVVS